MSEAELKHLDLDTVYDCLTCLHGDKPDVEHPCKECVASLDGTFSLWEPSERVKNPHLELKYALTVLRNVMSACDVPELSRPPAFVEAHKLLTLYGV